MSNRSRPWPEGHGTSRNPAPGLISRRALVGAGGLALAALVARYVDPPAHSLSETARAPAAVPARRGAAGVVATPVAAVPVNAPGSDDGPVIFLDPGHGGVDEGAVGTTADGQTVYEKDLTLAIAGRAADKLHAAGYQVVLSRTSDELPGLQPSDLTEDGHALTADGVLNDLQRRIDLANTSAARLFLSIHLNASDDTSARGSATYYDSARSFAADNRRFATLVQQAVLDAMHAQGYTTPDLGVIDDTQLESYDLGTLPDSYHHLVVLGPASPPKLRPTTMPGALSESLYLSNAGEVAAATSAQVQDIIAGAFTAAVRQMIPLSH